jgi:chlorite dismutase
MLTDADAIAFVKKVIELLEGERKALKAAGLDVDFMLSTLTNLLEQAAATEQQQEAAKRQTRASTESWLALKRKSYVTASGYLDMAMAAVSKDSATAKNFRLIRSAMHRPMKGEAPIITPAKV